RRLWRPRVAPGARGPDARVLPVLRLPARPRARGAAEPARRPRRRISPHGRVPGPAALLGLPRGGAGSAAHDGRPAAPDPRRPERARPGARGAALPARGDATAIGPQAPPAGLRSG